MNHLDQRALAEPAQGHALDRPTYDLFQSQVQEQEVPDDLIWLIAGQGGVDTFSRLQDTVGQVCHVQSPVSKGEDLVELLARSLVEAGTGRGGRRLQIRPGVYRLEDAEKDLKLSDQHVFALRVEDRVGPNRAIEALQPLAGNARLLQRAIETAKVAVAAQERQVSLADGNVVGGGVVVELLMPFLDKAPAHLFEVMTVHDVKDFVADALAVFPTAQGREQKPNPGPKAPATDRIPFRRLVAPEASQAGGQLILGLAQIARLGVVAPLPVELTHGTVAHPDEEEGQSVLVFLNLLEEIVTQVKAVHQSPGEGSSLGTDNAFDQLLVAGG